LPLPSSRDVGGTDLPTSSPTMVPSTREGPRMGRGGGGKQQGARAIDDGALCNPHAPLGGGNNGPESERGSVKPTRHLVQLHSLPATHQTAPKPNEAAGKPTYRLVPWQQPRRAPFEQPRNRTRRRESPPTSSFRGNSPTACPSNSPGR
jgi:hypothetical protein